MIYDALRGIKTVVYGVFELKNDQMLKISLKSIDKEDTTSISQAKLFLTSFAKKI